MSDQNKSAPAEERRRYFRIDDEVNLSYVRVEEGDTKELVRTSENILNNYSLTTALDMLTQESAGLLHRLERIQPDFVEYLRVLNNKIDLLAQAIVLQNGELDERHTRNVNLSAAGLAFESEEALEQSAFLEIKMTLVSCMAVIVTYGRVVYCKPNPVTSSTYPYMVGVDYVNMKEQDREVLIKHVLKKQLQQIRQIKENADKSI
ncbi:MAG: pilus assembly protein PilZ [Methylobacter sp.]|nr:MAG: pilus assembly protein PilZ [Methylobacter sp.]PPD03568.1 MAG: pilus assembly protein PilZ [Methylobacter sp.]PPD20850.1 MAG: pilus assembly protein PilZ [Methylobacter sp.]PPD36592.1 MAG: pilus assembly protein PilZ [Methylomonas sp.]